ncbi:T9SS type A sorting domain-containing protein [Lacinutrix sp. C3R15]|uniref:T9SS type A sorting domain-containing protein n=1 Tax=Flavobacteriaceae TaxID=49546 RepID=UPI001C0970B0|nr:MULTISPECIES: T9SS type A sorting domain-containing protein [Flavobacteriaceae]MBU2938775.1 T9SS type A sorting domain-containing protein [Lacinutrix sp. C3R15]MDO6622088.1 T9SS type A sorting domain-containing protein [Oceanihabitans sp. 1_MG-2023]
MKKTLLLLTMFIVGVTQAQTVLIPNGGFNTDTSGWSVTGTDITIASYSGEMYFNISGIYTRDFILASPQFYLEAGKTYQLYTDYRNVGYDMMVGEFQLGGFTDTFLKDINANTVANIGLGTCQTVDYLYTCNSQNFTVATSGIYYIEFEGQYGPEQEFIVDNVGFREIIANTFSGTVTLDVNNDGCATSTATVENYPIQVNETNSNTSFNTFTDANGAFVVETQNITGNFVTQTNYAVYDASPVSYTNVVSVGVNSFSNQDFCITPNTVANDLIVSVIPTTQARPGFDTSYQIRYTNYGTTTLSGIVDLTYDNSSVTYLNASTIPDATTISSLSWNYASLAPFETRTIDVNFNIVTPPTVNNGDTLTYTTSITPIAGDSTPTNNSYTFNQITIGSYDPNDITILEGPLISENQADDYLAVIIRFQNTGTASAINITVENTLDAFLDWTTFQPIAASHNYNTVISNGNEVDFVFNGINLADSTSDEPGSHGWVFYRIKPKSTFVVGDVISNKADIYFDYNLPIITNTATTQIDATLSVNEIDANKSLFSVYPNPTKNKLTVSIEAAADYSIVSVNGQLIKKGQLQTGENILNTYNLSNGLYFLQVITKEGVFTKKIIKQ